MSRLALLNLALVCGNLSGESFITDGLLGADLSPNQRSPIEVNEMPADRNGLTGGAVSIPQRRAEAPLMGQWENIPESAR
jgi:hypothetical protein